jgi:hypothetical protein
MNKFNFQFFVEKKLQISNFFFSVYTIKIKHILFGWNQHDIKIQINQFIIVYYSVFLARVYNVQIIYVKPSATHTKQKNGTNITDFLGH